MAVASSIFIFGLTFVESTIYVVVIESFPTAVRYDFFSFRNRKAFSSVSFASKMVKLIRVISNQVRSGRVGSVQGSVLGPLLWMVYDNLLRLKIPGVTQIGFADDPVLIVIAETQNTLE